MFHYLIKRAALALNQKKSWFLFPIAIVVAYIAYSYLTPHGYNISATVAIQYHNDNIKEDVINYINRLAGPGDLFIRKEVDQMPNDLYKKLAEGFQPSADQQGARPTEGDAAKIIQRKQAIDNAAHLISMIMDEEYSRFVFLYNGKNRSLGARLVEFYSQRLKGYMDTFKDDQLTKLQKEIGRQQHNKAKVTKKINQNIAKDHKLLSLKINLNKINQKIETINQKVKIFGANKTYSSTSSGAIIIAETHKLTDRAIALAFYLQIITILIVALVIVFIELSDQTITTERQISDYLGLPVLGMMPNLNKEQD